tara:strand:+ start:1506 stop:3857 length:2352 start_codon:yes stop_codon:yes gene_type:complete
MNKKIILIMIILLSAIFSDNEKKVALVLSGGGAKGIAQIPIIELIDSLQIPIDYIVGTSIGSINGAMYAMGYSPEEIKYYAYNTNWDLIFSNKKNRKDLFYFEKNDLNKYQIEFTLDGIKPVAPIALANGHSSYMDLNNKTKNYEHINDFDEFVIPYRCNSTNLLNGDEIIFNSGSLSNALRASSSIPSVFSPVKNDSLLLVDGGVINNLPIDIAKNLNADIIIGVNLSSLNKNSNDIKDIFDVLEQSILVNGYKRRIDNIKLADLIISPKIESYKTIDFSKQSLDQLYTNGKKAAQMNLNELIKIKKSLNIKENNKLKLSRINKEKLNIKNITIESSSIKSYTELFPHLTFPLSLKKDEFISEIRNLRDSNKYHKVSYSFIEKDNDLELILTAEKNPPIRIKNIFIYNNEILSDKFIKELLNLKSENILSINNLRSNINKAYNLELFSSIRYELVKQKNTDYDIIINVEESPYHTMKFSGIWDNYYKLIGNIKFSIFNKPIKKFKFTNQIRFGNNITENNINMFYIGNYNYQTQIIPTIKYKNSKKDVDFINPQSNNYQKGTINNKNFSINAIIPLKNFGFIDVGINKQKIKLNNNIEHLSYYSLILNIDQINDILYPSEGYNYSLYFENPIKKYNYYIYKINFDHYVNINQKNNLKIFGDIILSNLKKLDNEDLLEKNIHYFKFDRTLYNEYDLFANDLKIYGVEYNYYYKNSTTLRLIVNNINSLYIRNSDKEIKNIYNYGMGFRIKSVIGPINFLWSKTKDFKNNDVINNYFFSLGVNI